MSHQRIALERRRAEPILLGAVDHRDGVISFSLSEPRKVVFKTLDRSGMTILGVTTEVEGGFRLSPDLSLKASDTHFDVRRMVGGTPALFLGEDRDDKQYWAIEFAVVSAWRKLCVEQYARIHKARHDAADDQALWAMAWWLRAIEEEAKDPESRRSWRRCQEDAVHKLATTEADLWSILEALEDRPGYVATAGGELLGKLGWQSPVSKGWIPTYVHDTWRAANEVAEKSENGVVHRIRIIRNDVHLVLPDCMIGGMASSEAIWPTEAVVELEDA